MELSLEPEASDHDEADYQLLSESRASRPLGPVETSAERSANLLNAARAIPSSPHNESSHTRVFSSPGGMTQGKVKTGKLKRPSFQSANLAKLASESTGRRRSVYEFSSMSPEKSRFKLPETVNHKPLKIMKRVKPGKVKQQHNSKEDAHESLDVESQHTDDVNETTVRKSGRLAGEEADISGINWEKRPESKKPLKSRTKRKADAPDAEPNPRRKSPKEDAVTLSGAGEAESPKERRTRTRNKADHATSAPSVRISQREHLQKARAAKASQCKKGSNLQTMHKEPADDDDHTTAGHEEDALYDEPPAPPASRRGRKPKGGGIEPRPAATRPRTTRSTIANSLEAAQPVEEDFDGVRHISRENDEEANVLEEVDKVDNTDSDQEDLSQMTVLEEIFSFIELNEQDGRCQTKTGKKIKLNYDRACQFMVDNKDELSSEDVAEVYASLRSILKDVGDLVSDEDQMAFKADAFAYLFRSLTCLLHTVYDWSLQQFGDPLSSLPALRILVPLMEDVLSLKNFITAWKVQVPQRFQGDPSVKNVDQNLIAPLRIIKSQYRNTLDRLERAQQEEALKHEIRERRKQQEAGETRRLEERREKWQDLHICRMKIESRIDFEILKHLGMPPQTISDERDANGIPFEREPVFRERSSPFAYRTAQPDMEGWSDRQLAALVEGLEKYAGDDVFERLFGKYCRFGGPLEDFNVTEITSQAAYLRSVLIDRGRNHGYEVPEWVKKIPVLL